MNVSWIDPTATGELAVIEAEQALLDQRRKEAGRAGMKSAIEAATSLFDDGAPELSFREKVERAVSKIERVTPAGRLAYAATAAYNAELVQAAKLWLELTKDKEVS